MMLGKKQILMLLIVIVSISAISAVTAAQDNISSDEDTVTALNDMETISVDDDNNEALASGEESSLSQSDSGDILSAQNTPSDAYSIDLKDSYEISSSSEGKI